MPTDTSEKPQAPHVVFLLQDLRFGGTQRQAIELARRLDRTRFQVELWVMIAGDDLAAEAAEAGVPVVWLSRRERVGPVSLGALWRRLRSQRIDLLVLLTVVPNIWGRLLGRLAHVPVIVGSCRGGGPPERQHEQRLWRLADHLVCNCRAMKELLVGRCHVPAERITVIPNGVDLERFGGAGDRAASSGPLILNLARLAADKDHETLLAAFGRAVAAVPEAELWVVGDGPRRRAVEHLVRSFTLPGRIWLMPPQPDVGPLLQQSSMLALSSTGEGMPNAILEAMAVGLPVVATDVGGVAEAVVDGETGLLVPPRNPEALAEALIRLLRDQEMRRRFGEAGRRRVEEHFAVECMVRAYDELLVALSRGSARHTLGGPGRAGRVR